MSIKGDLWVKCDAEYFGITKDWDRTVVGVDMGVDAVLM